MTPSGLEAFGQLVQVDQFVLERPPQTLNDGIVQVPAPAVPGDRDTCSMRPDGSPPTVMRRPGYTYRAPTSATVFRGVYFGFPIWSTRFGTFMLQTSVRVGRMGSWPIRQAPDTISWVHVAIARAGSGLVLGTLLEHLSRVAPALHYPCSVAPAGMSRPLLEFGGGSGEILRDLLHLRSVSEAEALISCAEGRDQLRHISQPRLTCRPFRLISGLERTGGQRRLQEPSALERGRSGPRRQRGRFRGRGPGPPTPGIAQLSLLPACCQSAPVPAASGSRGTADSGPGCAAGSKRTTRARLAARGAA